MAQTMLGGSSTGLVVVGWDAESPGPYGPGLSLLATPRSRRFQPRFGPRGLQKTVQALLSETVHPALPVPHFSELRREEPVSL